MKLKPILDTGYEYHRMRSRGEMIALMLVGVLAGVVIGVLVTRSKLNQQDSPQTLFDRKIRCQQVAQQLLREENKKYDYLQYQEDSKGATSELLRVRAEQFIGGQPASLAMKPCASIIVVTGILLLSVACDETTNRVPNLSPGPTSQPEQDLPITFGGFIENGPEDQLLSGQCRTNVTRDVLQCDIHNGLLPWNITEITFQVVSYRENEHHYYRERVSIASLQTETVTIKLGMQLPADTHLLLRGGQSKIMSHWDWLIVGAKGQPVK